MKRPRGNPTWGKSEGLNLPVIPSQWELELKHLRIADPDTIADERERGAVWEQIFRSVRLKQFARQNCNGKYVPEKLLDPMGLAVDIAYSW